MAAIGIDLGTTYSCVACWRQGTVEVIVSDEGNRNIPSFVSFTETERLIGESAKNQSIINPLNTVFAAKRLIGRRYDDLGLQMDLRHFPFKVLDDNGKPVILVEYKGERKKFAPEEISGMLLFRMKEIAEAYLGVTVEAAVITVPAYFNDNQRHATRTAALLAGLKVLRITNEPTAAALAFGLDRKLNSNVLVYDLGGGTFDVSVLNIGNSVYKVKSTAGNTRLGGEDFDNRMVAYFAQDFKNKFHMDITTNARSVRRLKTACERAKRFLTSASEAIVNVDSLYSGIDYSGRISRALFEELCSDLFKDTLTLVHKVLIDGKLSKTDINKVVLVGGSTRIPRVKLLLKEFFGETPVTAAVNPEEAVACGAAIQAAILAGEKHKYIKDLLLIDVVPLSLGVETSRGIMYRVIERNTAIPCSRTKDLTTLEDNQRSMTIEIFEGERSLTKDNNLLGVFELVGLPPAPRGVATVDVTFEVDHNGMLSVTARDRITGNSESITIRNEHRLKQNDIGRMLADAETYQMEDKKNKLRLEARNQLETYIYGARQIVITKGEFLSPREKGFILDQCEKAIQWLEENNGKSKKDFEVKMKELMSKWNCVLKKIHNPWQHEAKKQRTEDYEGENEMVSVEEIFTV